MRKKFGLALSAGGARGIAHVGFLQALDEEGLRPDCIAGSSMGSVIGACYAHGMTPAAMTEVLQQLRAGDIVNIGLTPISKLGLMKWTKVRKLMSSHLQDCTFDELEIPFRCVAVDLKSGRLHTFSEGSVIDAILASSSIPTVFRPVELNGALYIDGGVICRVPVKQVKEMGADVVVAVDVLSDVEEVENVSNVFALVMRVYDIMDANKTAHDRRRWRRITDLWLEPHMPGVSQYRFKFDREVYDAGYRCGKENAAKIRALLEG